MKFVVRLCAVMLFLMAGSAGAQELKYKIDHVLGKPDAPVTIVEYASLTCGHCATFHKNVLPKLKSEWIDTGKAKLVYRDFPTGPKNLSVGASMINHCAQPEFYFRLLSVLMESQESWMTSGNPLVELKKYAKLAGVSSEKVDACLKDQTLASAIEERAVDAHRKYGIEGTPTLLVNGKVVPGGAVSFEELDKALKAAGK